MYILEWVRELRLIGSWEVRLPHGHFTLPIVCKLVLYLRTFAKLLRKVRIINFVKSWLNCLWRHPINDGLKALMIIKCSFNNLWNCQNWRRKKQYEKLKAQKVIRNSNISYYHQCFIPYQDIREVEEQILVIHDIENSMIINVTHSNIIRRIFFFNL